MLKIDVPGNNIFKFYMFGELIITYRSGTIEMKMNFKLFIEIPVLI